LRVWVCWQSLQVEYTGSFLVFNRACVLASACPTRAIPAFGQVTTTIITIILRNKRIQTDREVLANRQENN
jgi:hypothetical protein